MKKICIDELSGTYRVRALHEQDIPEIYALFKGNPLYFEHMHSSPSTGRILEDLRALPPGRTPEDKYYIGFFHADELIAVMDLIGGYPDERTALIGFFMLKQELHGQGIAGAIISDTLKHLKACGYSVARLGYVKGNSQSERFWLRNGFTPTGRENRTEDYTIVVMERKL